MSQRMPLTTLHNECFARRKVQRTYGKKGKASAALLGTQDFLKMTHELEKKLAAVSIFEERDPDGKENEEAVELVQDRKQSNTGRKKTVKTKARPKGEEKEATFSVHIDTVPSHTDTTPSFDGKKADPSDATSDDQAIASFIEVYANKKPLMSFEDYGNRLNEIFDIKKIGEGTYSSAFALTPKKGVINYRHTIIKLMPVVLPSEKPYEGMTVLSDVANEAQILSAMDPIHGFVRYRGVTIVKGDWPSSFLEPFRLYNKEHDADTTTHDDPTELFDDTQHYALLEMGDAGSELNDLFSEGKYTSVFQIYDIFWSVCLHLAHSESLVQFEHRDMHISNICVKPTDPASDRLEVEEPTVADMHEKPDIILGMTNIAVTMIDYTLSRLTLSSKPETTGDNVFRHFIPQNDYDDLKMMYKAAKKPTIPAKLAGIIENWEQDLTYAKMGKCIDANFEKAKQEARRDVSKTTALLAPWEYHVPQVNVCWLGYLLTVLMVRDDKLCKPGKYLAGSNRLARRVQDDIRRKLLAVEKCLKEDDFDKMPKSANDVVRIGVAKGWLNQEEIDAFKSRVEKIAAEDEEDE